MKYSFTLKVILMAAMTNTSLASENENRDPPEPKFQIGDCILGTNPRATWYKREAEVFDIAQSSRYDAKIYILYLRTKFHDVHTYGFYDIAPVDRTSVKVGEGSCAD